jgi:hypothetical protein
MNKKEIILDSLADDREAGESETQILEYFKLSEVIAELEDIRKLICELIAGELIYNSNWVDSEGKPMYAMTKKGRIVWSKIK